MNLRDQILNAKDLKTQVVEVPEWGCSVTVATMSGTDRDKLEIDRMNNQFNNWRAKLCAYCVVDESGKRVFTDADIEALGGKSTKALERVFDVATKLNAYTAEDIDDLEKKSEGIPGDDGS